MPRISEQTIEKVRSASDIVEIIQGYVQMKQKGRNFFGLCPFHNEKTPSFSVNPEKQIFKCFGCGIGGGVINFIMEIEKLEFKDSVIFLAEHFGIEIELDESYAGSNDINKQLLLIHQEASKIFSDNLNTEKGREIYSHLLKRGLTKETIKTFSLGYSLNENKQLLKYFQNQDYSSEALLKSGLFIDTKKGYLDRFKGRIIFSIHNPTGKIIAFSGRIVKDDNMAKYINSPETPIYYKSNILYGLHESKHHIRTLNSAIVVEGYFDYLQLFQAGINNVVAISGTAFTNKHAQLLRRYTNNIYLAYDGDKAGLAAAIKAGYILLKYGHNPKIINLPKEIDPDDWIYKEGVEPFKKALKTSSNIIDFHMTNSQFDTSTESGKFNFIEEALNYISEIEDPVYREIQVQSLSNRTQIREESIYQKLNKIISSRTKYKTPEKINTRESQKNSSSTKLLEEDLIKLCFSKDLNVRSFIFDNLNRDWITDVQINNIYEIIYIHLKSDYPPNPSIILNEIKDLNNRSFLSGLLFDLENIKISISMGKECLIRLEKDSLGKKLYNLRNQLKQIPENQMTEVMEKISIIENTLKEIHTKYNAIKKT